MKITDMIVSTLLKRGVVWEARDVDVDVDIPPNKASQPESHSQERIKVHLKVDHMSIQIEKRDKT